MNLVWDREHITLRIVFVHWKSNYFFTVGKNLRSGNHLTNWTVKKFHISEVSLFHQLHARTKGLQCPHFRGVLRDVSHYNYRMHTQVFKPNNTLGYEI